MSQKRRFVASGHVEPRDRERIIPFTGELTKEQKRLIRKLVAESKERGRNGAVPLPRRRRD